MEFSAFLHKKNNKSKSRNKSQNKKQEEVEEHLFPIINLLIAGKNCSQYSLFES